MRAVVARLSLEEGMMLPSCGTYILFLDTSLRILAYLRHCFHTSLTHNHKYIIKDGPLPSEAVTSDSGDSR